jgi:hypothetical protein
MLENRKTLLIVAILACILLAFHFIAKKQVAGEDADRMINAFKGPSQWQGKTAPDFDIDLLSGDKLVSADQVGPERFSQDYNSPIPQYLLMTCVYALTSAAFFYLLSVYFLKKKRLI